jgi:hypothetical protein
MVLDNGTRAAAIAGVSPTLDYRFAREKREIETVSLTDKLTYTGGNGTFVGSDGFIQRATTNIPRFDHDPLSRRSLGLLSEVERTNRVNSSNTFSGTGWSNVAADPTIVADATAQDPTGAASNRPTAAGGKRWAEVTGVTTNVYTASMFVKRENGATNQFSPSINIGFGFSGNSQNVEAQYDWNLDQLVIRTGSPTALFATKYPNGWVRISITNTDDGSGTETRTFQPSWFTNAATSGTGGNSRGGYVFGFQAEIGSTPSTYIPTTTAAVTRTADSAVIDGTGVITGTYTMVEKPAGCAVVSGTNINLQPGFTAERVMVFPAALDAGQITAIRGAM